ncbi:glycosyltransferase family 4 protein [Endozoicomonas elysicola]|uniref:glycosyltransferase family 4 protein n=1 Tax=Endozoicomonas elysicola TaxID=305900 RepID=UPI0012F9E01E|nr:glycosyltransferase family 1 protein [Endozoicomonas elysicola]
MLIDARCLNDSGLGVYTVEIIRSLSKLPIQIGVLINPGLEDNLSILPVQNYNVIEVNYGRFSYKNLFSLSKHLKKYDLYFLPSPTVAPLNSSIRIISTIHDVCPLRFRRFFGIKVYLAFYLILFLQIIRSSKLLTISEFSKSEILSFFKFLVRGKPVIAIKNGLPRRFSSNKGEVSELIKKMMASKYLLCVGNVKPHKNIKPLINYFISQNGLHSKYKLVIVGRIGGFITGESIDHCHKDIVFTDYVNDHELSMLYENASAFIYPSLYEGFGLPLLEAMKFKLPIAASNLPVFHEVAGNSISYFDPVTFTGLDDFILSIKDNEKSNYEELLAVYNWDDAAEMIYQEFL